MQIKVSVKYSDLDDYNKGLSIKATPFEGAPVRQVLRMKPGDHIVTATVDSEEIILQSKQALSGGISNGDYIYYMIQKKKTLVPSINTADMVIDTPSGIISAAPATDKANPGIYISVEGVELVLVEYDSLIGKAVIRVWDHHNPNQDPCYRQVVRSLERIEHFDLNDD